MDASPRCCQGGTRCWTGYDARHLLKLTHYPLTTAWEHARTFDVPVALDLSKVIGRD